ncbi:uncharacterized protein TA17215 [Theileria annulata]|uniref:Uncharacterized protein n=1 Tax=Theileria annulata TaxID=5874 RepID=Q4UAQ4_THEAN|nr:uncharacterized protein TA17215 [Theileria annulata]CAI76097.1 hypothetical protein TA17215 [Theileria annulata]|eukprot:XP_952723.1 hypothetical protein TA17215 [Theileria annulata]
MSDFRNLFIVFLFYISNLLVKNVLCAVGLLANGSISLDLDLGSLDLEKINIIKSLDKPDRYKINAKEGVLINSIRLLNNVLWTQVGVSTCQDLIIYDFAGTELVVSIVINNGGIKNVYYTKKFQDGYSFIRLPSFLTLIHDEFKPKGYLIPEVLDLSDEFHKVFFDYTIMMMADLIYEKYKPSNNSGFGHLMDGLKTIWINDDNDSKGKVASCIEIFDKQERIKMLKITLQDLNELHFIWKDGMWTPLLGLGFKTNYKRLGFKRLFEARSESEGKEKDLDPLPKILDLNKKNDSFSYSSYTFLNMNFLVIRPLFEFLTKKIVHDDKEIYGNNLCKFILTIIRTSEPVRFFVSISVNETSFTGDDIYFERSESDGEWKRVNQFTALACIQKCIVESTDVHYLKSADLYGIYSGAKVNDLPSKVKSKLTGQDYTPTPTTTPIPQTPTAPTTTGSLPTFPPSSTVSTPPPTSSTALPSSLVSSQTSQTSPRTSSPMPATPSLPLPDKVSTTKATSSSHIPKKSSTFITKPPSPAHLSGSSSSRRDSRTKDETMGTATPSEPRHRKRSKSKRVKPPHDHRSPRPRFSDHSPTYTEYTPTSSKELTHSETHEPSSETGSHRSLSKESIHTPETKEPVITPEHLEQMKQDIISRVVEIIRSEFFTNTIAITSLTLLPTLLI